jgi:DNA polymerase-3 subunit alpha
MHEIEVNLLPPDLNESAANFTPLKQAVRFGLNAIKGLGENSVREILNVRLERPFTSIFDFTARVPSNAVNRRSLESLIGAGAFDSLNKSDLTLAEWRSRQVGSIDKSLNFAKKQQQDVQKGQSGLFLSIDKQGAEPELMSTVPWSNKMLWTAEKQALGFYLTSHPLDGAEDLINELGIRPIAEMGGQLAAAESNLSEPLKVWITGAITNLQIRTSKKGKRFAIFKLEDRSGNVKCLVWDEAFNNCSALLQDDQIVIVTGTTEVESEGNLTVVAEKVMPLNDAKPNRAAAVVITPQIQLFDENSWESLLTLLNRHRGRCPVYFDLPIASSTLRSRIAAHNILSVQGSSQLENELLSAGCAVKWHLSPIKC